MSSAAAADIASPNSSADDVFRNCSKLLLLLLKLLLEMVPLLLPLNKMLSAEEEAAAEDAAAFVVVSIIDIWLLSSILESFCVVNGNPMLIFNISSMINIGGTRNITSTKPSIFVRIDIVAFRLMFDFPVAAVAVFYFCSIVISIQSDRFGFN